MVVLLVRKETEKKQKRKKVKKEKKEKKKKKRQRKERDITREGYFFDVSFFSLLVICLCCNSVTFIECSKDNHNIRLIHKDTSKRGRLNSHQFNLPCF